MPEALTRAQTQLLEHLRSRARLEQQPPSLPELCAELGLRSRGSLHKQVQALVAAGLVWPMDGRQRGVRLREDAGDQPSERIRSTADEREAEQTEVPLRGRVSAGRPIEAVDDPQGLQVPGWMVQGHSNCYALRVRGDSMRDIGILDDDLVLVRPSDTARNGDVVVALIDSGEVTLKRIEQRHGEVLLHSENPDVPVQRFAPDSVRIQGILVAQLRRYA